MCRKADKISGKKGDTMLVIILNWFMSDIFRPLFVATALICIVLYASLHIQSLRLREANLALQEKKAEIAKFVADGMIRDNKIAIATDELTRLRKRQVADARKIADLLKSWPTDCNEAATSAANILRERGI